MVFAPIPDTIEPGDTLGLDDNRYMPPGPVKVLRVTKTQVIVDKSGREVRYNRRSGRPVGGKSDWSVNRLYGWNDEMAERRDRAVRVRRTRDQLRTLAEHFVRVAGRMDNDDEVLQIADHLVDLPAGLRGA